MTQSISLEKKNALEDLLKEVRAQGPEMLDDMTDDEIVRYLIRETFATDRRRNAIQMLEEMSADAIEYVYKFILWTYNYTDMHDPDSLSDEDSERFSLARTAMREDHETVKTLNLYSACMFRRKLNEIRKERQCHE